MVVQRKNISWVELRLNFERTSYAYGFNKTKIDKVFNDILLLIKKWRNDSFVDIYQTGDKHSYGMIKPSSIDASGKTVLYFADFFHGRIFVKIPDPLLLITFEDVEGEIHPWLIIETLINHDQFFGRLGKFKHLKRHQDNLRIALARRINFCRFSNKKEKLK